MIFVEDPKCTALVWQKGKYLGIGPEGVEGLELKRGSFAIGEEGFG